MWVKLDDNFHDHPKVIRAGLEAIGLFTLGLSYAARHLTDGKIPEEFVGKRKRLAARLVEVRLWEHDGTSYQIHDYLDYNPPASRVRRDRRAARVRMKRLRTTPEVRQNKSGSSPSRPVPVQSDKNKRDLSLADEQARRGRHRLAEMAKEILTPKPVPMPNSSSPPIMDGGE